MQFHVSVEHTKLLEELENFPEVSNRRVTPAPPAQNLNSNSSSNQNRDRDRSGGGSPSPDSNSAQESGKNEIGVTQTARCNRKRRRMGRPNPKWDAEAGMEPNGTRKKTISVQEMLANAIQKKGPEFSPTKIGAEEKLKKSPDSQNLKTPGPLLRKFKSVVEQIEHGF